MYRYSILRLPLETKEGDHIKRESVRKSNYQNENYLRVNIVCRRAEELDNYVAALVIKWREGNVFHSCF